VNHGRALVPAVGLALLVLLPAGCGFFEPSIAVEKAGAAKVHASLNENVFDDGQLSTATREVLHSYALGDLYADDPLAALRALHEATVQEGAREGARVNVFALSELAFSIGREREDRDCYLASSVYAYLYLFGTEDPEPPNPYDRRFRWACDLYNSGLQSAFTTSEAGIVTLGNADRQLPVGSIHLDVDRSAFPYPESDYREFVPGDLFLIQGLSLRIRDSGLGVPLIALPANAARKKTAASAFLRVSGGLADMSAGLRGTVELYHVFDARAVQVAGAKVPLESDVSVTLAYSLHESPIWKFSLTGLFEGERAVKENRLQMVRPYEPGRIPVVFVHGTASNPAYWAEMLNTLYADPELRERMQFWYFQYASGNPILFTAATLREQLAQTLAAIDPDGKDPALRKMILIGHSQGGLVVKLVIVDGSMDWFVQSLGKPPEELGLDGKQLELIRRVFDFKALPFVSTAIFVCTPHGGSFRADSWYSRMIAKFIALPGEIQGIGDRLFGDETRLPSQLADRIPTSFDNMNPSSPLLRILRGTPVAPGVTCHSIIAIGGADPHDPESLAEADDGVVQYPAAHIDGVESELLVNASHSCQDNPLVIHEVRRILHEALGD